MADSLFKRKIYDRMLRWKEESNGDTALLIKGASESEINISYILKICEVKIA